MVRNFGTKFRVFAFSLIGVVTLIAFQNCGKNTNRILTTSIARAEPTPTTVDPTTPPDPIADPPEDVHGGTHPYGKTEAVPGYVSAIPDCFLIAPAGQDGAGNLVYMVSLQSGSNKTIFLDSGKLVLAGSSAAVEIPSSVLDRESASMEFHVKQDQLIDRGVSVKAAGPGWNVLLGECAL